MNLIEELIAETRKFARRRDWVSHHTSKDLPMAIAGEAGELASEFRWLSIEGSESSQLTVEQLVTFASRWRTSSSSCCV